MQIVILNFSAGKVRVTGIGFAPGAWKTEYLPPFSGLWGGPSMSEDPFHRKMTRQKGKRKEREKTKDPTLMALGTFSKLTTGPLLYHQGLGGSPHNACIRQAQLTGESLQQMRLSPPELRKAWKAAPCPAPPVPFPTGNRGGVYICQKNSSKGLYLHPPFPLH